MIGPPPTRLDQARLAELEPALAHNDGALFHPRDGAIDNVRLLAALHRTTQASADIDLIGDDPASEATQREVFWTLWRRIKIFASLPQGTLNRRALERRAVTLQASYL